jgi:hypothetical protein
MVVNRYNEMAIDAKYSAVHRRCLLDFHFLEMDLPYRSRVVLQLLMIPNPDGTDTACS